MRLADEIKAIDTTKKKLKEFGLLVGLVFAVIGGFMLWKSHGGSRIFLSIGGALMFLGVAAPATLRWVYRMWMTLALLLGWLVSRILLTLLFYLTVTPIGLLTKICGKKFLDLSFRDGRESYWIQREDGIGQKKQYEQQF